MERIGEIVATSSQSLTAVSFVLHQPPALGSLVQVRVAEAARTVYAVVSYGTTEGLDAGRHVVRRSTDDVHDAAIYAQHPQLEKTLHTQFQALLVGFADGGGRLYQHLPPQPPPLHYSVSACDDGDAVRFTRERRYFRLLLATAGEIPAEQLLAAHIREMAARRGGDQGWLREAARDVATLLKGEYDRLMGVLQAIQPE
jgi:hypothetical protein